MDDDGGGDDGIALFFLVIGEAESIDWYNPQGEKIISSQRIVVQKEGVRSRLTIYNANVEDAGIYRCQATDSRGQTQEATVVLEIFRKYNINGKINQTVMLCLFICCIENELLTILYGIYLIRD